MMAPTTQKTYFRRVIMIASRTHVKVYPHVLGNSFRSKCSTPCFFRIALWTGEAIKFFDTDFLLLPNFFFKGVSSKVSTSSWLEVPSSTSSTSIPISSSVVMVIYAEDQYKERGIGTQFFRPRMNDQLVMHENARVWLGCTVQTVSMSDTSPWCVSV